MICQMVWQFLKKLNIELQYDSAIPLLGINPKELKAGIQTDIGKPVFTAALLQEPKLETKLFMKKKWRVTSASSSR